MKSATTASTEIPHPAIAIPVCPVGTNTEAIPRRRASRSSSSETVIFPIAQSEPTVRTTFASSSRFRPVGTFRPAGGKRGELGVVRDELVQAVLDLEAGLDAALQELAPRGRKASARGSDPDE